jgi:hypothetical protein
MTSDDGLAVLVDYVTHAVPSSQLLFRHGPGTSQRVSLTFRDATGKQYLLDAHKDFYMRPEAAIRERLDEWNIAQELRNGGARTIRLDEEFFHVSERYV